MSTRLGSQNQNMIKANLTGKNEAENVAMLKKLLITSVVWIGGLVASQEVKKRTVTTKREKDFYLACVRGKKNRVRALVENGFDVTSSVGSLGLLDAAKNGHHKVVSYLLLHGADKNAANEDGDSLLHTVCTKRNLALVKLVLAAGANTEVRGQEQFTPLCYACRYGLVEVVPLLLDAGAAINNTSREVSPLSTACTFGHRAIVECLLAAGADMTAGSLPPLQAAAEAGSSDIIERLLAAGADKNAQNASGSTALNCAAAQGQVDAMRILIQAQAVVDIVPHDGFTEVCLACKDGNSEMVQLLLDAGASPDGSLVSTADTPLYYASERGDSDIVRILLAAKAQTELVSTISEKTPLYVACCKGHGVVVDMLLRAGANPYACDGLGISPLRIALLTQATHIAQLLLAHATIPPKESSLLVQASVKGNYAFVKLLLDAGIDAATVDNTGKTALEAAYQGGHTKIAELLQMHSQELKKKCAICGTADKKLGKCATCKDVYYCSTSCQEKDWPEHQKVCSAECHTVL